MTPLDAVLRYRELLLMDLFALEQAMQRFGFLTQQIDDYSRVVLESTPSDNDVGIACDVVPLDHVDANDVFHGPPRSDQVEPENQPGGGEYRRDRYSKLVTAQWLTNALDGSRDPKQGIREVASEAFAVDREVQGATVAYHGGTLQAIVAGHPASTNDELPPRDYTPAAG